MLYIEFISIFLTTNVSRETLLIMKDTLQPGLEYEHKFIVLASKTVPFLYPEAEEFQDMPRIFATGYLVGFIEWACIKTIQDHLDNEIEQTVGTHINISHEAPTAAGMEVTAKVKLVEVDGRKLYFEVEVEDGIDVIARGNHERYAINKESFNAKIAKKVELAKNH